MTRLFPLILPDKPSTYGPATKIGESDDPDEADQDQDDQDGEEEISDSYEQDTESESDETTE